MKARALEVTADRATVLIQPGWLLRLFGARDVTCELVRAVEGWRHAASQRRLDHAPHCSLILRALDFRPGAQMPRATVAREVGK